MKTLVAILALLVMGGSTVPKSRPHDHTIYVVRGSADKIDEFYREVGKNWGGGTLLEEADGGMAARYWAYSDRTAPQARTFIFGTFQFGLQLEMDAYDERLFFPAERSALDSIALKCGLSVDPFFITPKRELQVRFEPGDSYDSVDCTLGELKTSKEVRDLPTGFLGNDVLPERGS